MRESTPRLTVSTEGDITIVELVDKKILDEINISQIQEQMNALVAQSMKPKVVMDFVNVAHMSSSALGMLITLHKRVREKKGELRLCSIAPSIYEVFVITRLNEIFHISQNRQQALSSF